MRILAAIHPTTTTWAILNLEITLDFDAALSVHVNQTNGQHPYILHPVIHVVAMD